MKKNLLLILLMVLLPLFAWAETLKLSVLGDSLSAGYKLGTKESFCFQLEAALNKKGYGVSVLNHSVSGATSADGLRRLKGVVAKKPDAVIIQLGANDMLQKTDLAQTKKNLQDLIDSLKKKQIPVFLVGMEASTNLPETYRNDFRQMYTDLALDNELLLYPFFMQGLWKDDGTHLSEEYFLPDKIHPSAKGVGVMVKHILPAVEQFIAEDVADVSVKQGN